MPFVLEKFKKKEIEEKLDEIASILNIKDILNKRTYEISGGQQQRTACARAMINKPAISKTRCDYWNDCLPSNNSNIYSLICKLFYLHIFKI